MATRFHTGTLMDYLGMEPISGFIEFMIPHLGDEAFDRSTCVMWSKGNDTSVLVEAARKYPWAVKVLVPGWSINSAYVADRYELCTARTEQRLEAAVTLQQAGYRQTVRLDPLVPYPEWRTGYGEVVDMVLGRYGLRPSYMVLGSLRFDEQDMIDTMKARFPGSDLFQRDLPKEDQAKYRIPFEVRQEMYRFLIDRVRSHDAEQPIGVCMEDPQMWETLDLDPSRTCLAQPIFNEADRLVVVD
jgi:hypothetical protein